ncbi:Dolichyl-diphosphooligosaccharide-protein glycosyltransferase 48kDa subunit [Gonapodya prolifera JEL478]|uniref:Dolichyl-diphosphooligosaccharide--protein glycosyltransferase subunit WBP1 n=1 Tax=Gonapodya prolifera (strain JEL478) TaxID=1344416 RepID=A0A139AWE9_GONPJ|nr:Dolichyl-diphosphooligosaccharide-protein glycosyltransferase 48kDa subunit [Gonapodya prolifera JEL478]|eukprot:KXS21071.1 Dolichyl-diphosphooligosaccharide-protein glycosyltransferase 48kDa subunit [Gonapodya prolifera JEL478]
MMARGALFSALIALFLLNACAVAKSASGSRVLVLLDKLDDRADYSAFFSSLSERGFDVYFKEASDVSAKLVDFGERLYDHAILFSQKSSGVLSATKLVEFVKLEGNVLAAVGRNPPDNVRDFAYEFNVGVDETDTAVIDHFNFNSTEGAQSSHTTILANAFAPSAAVYSQSTLSGGAVLYDGVALKFGKNPLLLKLLVGSATTYTWGARESSDVTEQPYVSGSELILAGAAQTRSNARVTFVGSQKLFSDRHICNDTSLNQTTSRFKLHVLENIIVVDSKSGNAAFAADISKWTFQERGVLKISAVQHHKEDESFQRDSYRVKDHIVYQLDISEYRDGKWRPFVAPDVQVEAVMIDPYIRATLQPSSSAKPSSATATTYVTKFQLPDQYGVFTFKVDYRRPGYSWIFTKETLPVQQFRHNDYERFLVVASPYYAAALSTATASFLFMIAVMYSS